jgi:hypothetical protein
MNRVFQRHVFLSASQNQRLARACVGILLAGNAQIGKIARWVNGAPSKAGRVRFLQRLLVAPFLTQSLTYQPFLVGMLRGLDERTWHLLIDRTTWNGYHTEVLMVSLAYHRHALPVAWEVIDFGCTSAEEQIALLRQVVPLIPADCRVVLHGDTEFGSVAVMRFARMQGWDFILAQAANTAYRRWGQGGQDTWQMLRDLTIPKRGTVYLPNVVWTAHHSYGPLNGFAFYLPHQNAPYGPRTVYRYCATSLPMSDSLRRIGRRRWGIECNFKDFKSAGWEIEKVQLPHDSRRDSLLSVLSMSYLWATSVGRWLCKVGRRHEVDADPTRHLSLFRIGSDWLVAQFIHDLDWPVITTLYS